MALARQCKLLIIMCCFELVITSVASEYNRQGKVLKPNLKTQECLKTSRYLYVPNVFVCKDLGLCYKHYCKTIAEKCQVCQQRKRKSHDRKPADMKADYYHQRNKERSRHMFPGVKSKMKNELSAPSATFNSLVKILVGNTACTGFFASIPTKRHEILVVTAANCLVTFDVKCTILSVNGSTIANENATTCLAHGKSRITAVDKRFKSYCAKLEYKGKTMKIPLNSKNVLVPREFMECRNCQHDIAVLRLRQLDEDNLNLTGNEVLLLNINSTYKLKNRVVAVESHPEIRQSKEYERFFRKQHSVITDLGVVVRVSKLQFCVELFNATQSITKSIIGSPILLYDDKNKPSSSAPRVTGIVTQSLLSAKQEVGTLSAVRMTDNFIKYITMWLNVPWKSKYCSTTNDVRLHPRYDCFPSLLHFNKSVYSADESTLCLCARGWTSERHQCRDPDVINLSNCTWNGEHRAVTCPAITTTQSYAARRQVRSLDMVAIPGSTRKLNISSNTIGDGQELPGILRHLAALETLIVDNNNLKIVHPDTFMYGSHLHNLSIRNNSITRLHRNTFKNNKYLLQLQLESNNLPFVSRNMFRQQIKLHELDLSNNFIKRLSRKSFRKNISLKLIKLSHNYLTSVPKTLLKTNYYLVEIWLDHNSLTSIPSSLFNKCPYLLIVKLEGNSLTLIPRELFRFNLKLSMVNLSENSLVILPNNLFSEKRIPLKVILFKNPDLPSVLTSPIVSDVTSWESLIKFLKLFGSK